MLMKSAYRTPVRPRPAYGPTLRSMTQAPDDPYAGLVPVRQRGMIVWAERRPSRCPAGHRLKAGVVLIGWLGCSCQYPALGHRTWLCCYIVTDRECGLTVYAPPHRP
jgi:hypothetical protein